MATIGGNARTMARVCRWAKRVALASAVAALSVSSQTFAQVEWKTSLSLITLPVAAESQTAVGAPDGSTYIAGITFDGERSALRVSRLSANGIALWTRWLSAYGYDLRGQKQLTVHDDNSVSVFYRGTPFGQCVEHLSPLGESTVKECDNSLTLRFARANDGEMYIGSGDPRRIKKVSLLGLVRWEKIEAKPSLYVGSTGVDSNGNYFEFENGNVTTWASTDGTKLGSVVLLGQPGSNAVVARGNLSVVSIRSTAVVGNAVTTTVARYEAGGTLKWSRDVIFPNTASADVMFIKPADNDATYLVRTPAQDGDSQVAKISSTGVVLWQSHYSRVRRIIDSDTGLLAIRSDVDATNSTNDSFIFPIATVDGALGTPTIYSRSDLFPPSD